MTEKSMQSVAELKKMVIDESDLSKIINYFFDLAECKILPSNKKYLTNRQIKASREIRSMTASVEKMLRDFCKEKIKITQTILTYISNERFYHGVYKIRENQCATSLIPVFYFNDLKMCVFCVTKLGGSIDCFRFSMIESSAINSPN
jgi:hypothetical protein